MKLSVNPVGQGRYWLIGQEVDESIVPPELRKYPIFEGSGGSPMPVAILERERGRIEDWLNFICKIAGLSLSLLSEKVLQTAAA